MGTSKTVQCKRCGATYDSSVYSSCPSCAKKKYRGPKRGGGIRC